MGVAVDKRPTDTCKRSTGLPGNEQHYTPGHALPEGLGHRSTRGMHPPKPIAVVGQRECLTEGPVGVSRVVAIPDCGNDLLAVCLPKVGRIRPQSHPVQPGREAHDVPSSCAGWAACTGRRRAAARALSLVLATSMTHSCLAVSCSSALAPESVRW